MKQPIAMRCTKKQWKQIKDKLNTDLRFIVLVGAFKDYKYLTNYYNSVENEIGFTSKNLKSEKSALYEEWNEKIFLEACGIEVEKTFSITESQIKNLCNPSLYNNTERLKEMFPEAFESEVKLEAGKWYKDKSSDYKGLINVVEYNGENKGVTAYGFQWRSGNFVETHSLWVPDKVSKVDLVEATEQEVFESLKNEAVKKYKKSSCIPLNIDLLDGYKNNYQELYFEKYCRLDDYNRLWVNFGKWNAVVFDNGKWAEIVETITLSEAEQQLKKKIIFNK